MIDKADKNVLHDVLLWTYCQEIASNKDITLSVSSEGYEVDKGYRFTNLQDLCIFLDGWGL